MRNSSRTAEGEIQLLLLIVLVHSLMNSLVQSSLLAIKDVAEEIIILYSVIVGEGYRKTINFSVVCLESGEGWSVGGRCVCPFICCLAALEADC